MACRSGILIDNFLEQSKFDALSAKVASSSTYTTSVIKDLRDDLFTEAYTLVFERLKEIGLYQEHFSEFYQKFSNLRSYCTSYFLTHLAKFRENLIRMIAAKFDEHLFKLEFWQ